MTTFSLFVLNIISIISNLISKALYRTLIEGGCIIPHVVLYEKRVTSSGVRVGLLRPYSAYALLLIKYSSILLDIDSATKYVSS